MSRTPIRVNTHFRDQPSSNPDLYIKVWSYLLGLDADSPHKADSSQPSSTPAPPQEPEPPIPSPHK